MQIDAILCNHAEAVNDLLYMAGGGIGVPSYRPGSHRPTCATWASASSSRCPGANEPNRRMVEVELVARTDTL